MGKTIDIGGRIHNPEVGNIVTGANEIYDDTKQKKQDVINGEVDIALEALDANKQDNLTFDQTPTEDSTNPVTSGGVYAADLALQQAIEAILTLIPSAASALNQLADKSFVNSSIATASATFRGTYNLVSDLHLSVTASHQDIATALASAVSTADNNDYCFVQIPTSDTSSDIRVTERYKFNGTAWAYEYDLNNSGFTAQQWEAINSGITALLVTKLGALPTAAELATSLAGKQNVLTFDNVPVSGSDNPVKSGGLYQLFTAIDAKFPSDASANNKLVAENRLAAYVTAVIEALDASFDLTSADGHVTFRMTQTNGVIASVQILTSDIASASALTTLGGRVSTNETDIANLQAAYAALTQSDVIIVNGALPTSGQQQNVIYRQPDPDHTPPQFYSDYMWNGTTWVLMATYNNAIDPRPKKGSQNLVTSGGVFDNMGALDVSELNATESPHTLATYADLSAALAAIPSDYQKGGMSIKFVQSSDNKYVQYRLMSNTFNTAVDNWQGIDNEPINGSNNLIKSGGIVSSVYDANALTDNFIVNRIIKNIIYTEADLSFDRRHQLSIGALIGGRYYNVLYLRRGTTTNYVVFEKNFATLSEAIADFKANPLVSSDKCSVEFNTDVVRNESLSLNFQFINKVDAGYNNSIYTNLILRKGLFKPLYSEGNALIAEILHFEQDDFYLDNILVGGLATLNSSTGKYEIDLQSVYTKEGSTTSFGSLLYFAFDTKQEAIDYWNENIGGHILPMSDGRGYVLYNKLDGIEMIPKDPRLRIYLDKDTSLLENAPKIVDYIGGLNSIFLFDTKLNLLVDELYFNPNYIDYSTIDFVRICIGGTIGGTIYNLVYVYRTGGLSARVLWQETYQTVSAAISNFKGIHGNEYGYIKANDKFIEQFYKGFWMDVPLSQINVTRLSLDWCPKIAEFINPTNALANKNVIWEGDSIAAGNAYGNAAWRRPIELKYGMMGTSYAVGGSVITSNVINPDTQLPVTSISGRIDEEVAANPNMQYFIFDGGTNDADRIGRIVHWKSGTDQTIHERTDPSNWPAKFGTWNETDFSGNYDKNTFCGAFEYIIWKVMSSCRYVKIGYIVAQKMGDSSGLTFFNRLEYFREAMAICKKWGVPVINLWEDSWMNSNMPNQYDPSLSTAAEHVANGDYYVDTQHPAPAGYNYLSNLIGHWMNEL